MDNSRMFRACLGKVLSTLKNVTSKLKDVSRTLGKVASMHKNVLSMLMNVLISLGKVLSTLKDVSSTLGNALKPMDISAVEHYDHGVKKKAIA